MSMKKQALFLLVFSFFISPFAYPQEEDNIMAQVRKIYDNYRASQPSCGYPENPDILGYPEGSYTLGNPYNQITGAHSSSLEFKIRDFSIGASDKPEPQCGKLSVVCASLNKSKTSPSDYYCERLHNGLSSEDSLLSNPKYNKYIAYQTIYYRTAMPAAKKDFGKLEKPKSLDAFKFFSPSKPNSSYDYGAVVYTASPQYYPNPATPPVAPNYNNGGYGLFVGSAANMKSLCLDMKNKKYSLEDARIRISQFLGLPADSPDVTRKLVFFNLRNNPHKTSVNDGNMFRPCPRGGNLYSGYCLESVATIPQDCSNAPSPYDGVTVSLFLANQYYSSYCNTKPNAQSGTVTLYPWTGQGFTYDWDPWKAPNEVQGTSEYVAAANIGNPNNMIVTKQLSLEDFLSSCEFK